MALVTSTKATYRAGSLYVAAETNAPQLTASGFPAGVVQWSDNNAGGAFVPATGNVVVYTPANRTQDVTITASVGATSVNFILAVTGTFPLPPDVDYDADLDDHTVVSAARDKSDVRDTVGKPFGVLPVLLSDRMKPQYVALRNFWLNHRKTVSFYVVDSELKEQFLMKFDSGMRTKVMGANSYDMSCTMKGEYVGVVYL